MISMHNISRSPIHYLTVGMMMSSADAKINFELIHLFILLSTTLCSV